MPESHYQWDPKGSPPVIKLHTIAKHEILRSYLVAYLQTLTASPRLDRFPITLVDGFSGGGVYAHETTGEIVLGSPFVMKQAVEEAKALINQDRQKKIDFDVDYFFIDKSKAATERLLGEIQAQGLGGQLDQSIFVRKSTFEKEVGKVVDHILAKTPRAGRAIFLLDQYGYSKVPTAMIRSIFERLPGAEIILNFSVDSFLNYADGDEVMAKSLQKVGLASLFRGRAFDDIKANEKDWRLFIQACLHKDLVDACGARYYTTFFIRSARGHGDYWLVHLSQRPRARDVMTKVHWEKNNYFIHYGGAGLDMFSILGYATKQDVGLTRQASLSFGYEFDEPAKAASGSLLREQIPKLIYPAADGMTFGELFATTCNYSPAHSDIYRGVIGELISHKEIEAISPEGVHRRNGNQVKDGDQIIAPVQRTLFFP